MTCFSWEIYELIKKMNYKFTDMQLETFVSDMNNKNFHTRSHITPCLTLP